LVRAYAYNQYVLWHLGSDNEDYDRHNLPHIHVRHAEWKASVAIEDGGILAGGFPPKQLKMVHAWIEIHKDELFADWELALQGEQPFRIAPLQ